MYNYNKIRDLISSKLSEINLNISYLDLNLPLVLDQITSSLISNITIDSDNLSLQGVQFSDRYLYNMAMIKIMNFSYQKDYENIIWSLMKNSSENIRLILIYGEPKNNDTNLKNTILRIEKMKVFS